MKPRTAPYEPATAWQANLLPPLLHRLLTPDQNAFVVPYLPLIRADATEFVALKIKPHAQLLGLTPLTTPLAAVISLATPVQIAASFGTLDEALRVGNAIENGEALMYGLGTSAIRYRDSEAAEALIRFSPRMSFNYQFDKWMLELLDPARLDAALIGLTFAPVRPNDAMIWCLLEAHKQWSERLSTLTIDMIRSCGTQLQTSIWAFRGNGFAENVHPSLIADAIAALAPYAKTEANAARWTTKLKARRRAAGCFARARSAPVCPRRACRSGESIESGCPASKVAAARRSSSRPTTAAAPSISTPCGTRAGRAR